MSANPPQDLNFRFYIDDVGFQVKRLRQLFPKMGYAAVPSYQRDINHYIDGYFVLFPYTVVHKDYLQALHVLASMIREHRGVTVDMECDGKINPRRFSRTKRIDHLYTPKKLSLAIVPVQVARSFMNKDPEQSVHRLMNHEFALDSFSILLSLLLSDSLWEFSKTSAIVSGDRDNVAHLQCVHGNTPNSWNNSTDTFEVSPHVYNTSTTNSFVFPTGFMTNW